MLSSRTFVVGSHSPHLFRQFRGSVMGAKGSLHGVTVLAIQQSLFLLFRTGGAQKPFRVRKLRGEIFCAAEIQIETSRLVVDDRDGLWIRKFISCCPDA